MGGNLGMDILIDEDVEITPLELTAGLLWEITYYGGTEEMSHENQKTDIQSQRIMRKFAYEKVKNIFFQMPQYGISRAITLHCQFKTAAL